MIIIALGLTFTTTAAFLSGTLFVRSVFSDKKSEIGYLISFAIMNGLTIGIILKILGQ